VATAGPASYFECLARRDFILAEDGSCHKRSPFRAEGVDIHRDDVKLIRAGQSQSRPQHPLHGRFAIRDEASDRVGVTCDSQAEVRL
jgi:hypothetical protein